MPEPIPDIPFIQKVANHATLPGGRHPNDVRALARTPDGQVWVGTSHGLYHVQGDAFIRIDDDLLGYPDIKCLHVDREGRLWAGMGLGLASKAADGDWDIHLSDAWDAGAITALLPSENGTLVATSEGGLHRFDGELNRIAVPALNGRAIHGITRTGETTLVFGQSGGVQLDGNLTPTSISILPGVQIRDVFVDGTHTYFATSDGLYQQEGTDEPRWVKTPIRDIHSVTRTQIGIACATSSGICIHAPDRWHYMAGPRWLPSDDTRQILEVDDTLYVATGNGCGRITLETITLAGKEPSYQQRIRSRHLRLKGFVTTSHLAKAGDLSTNVPAPSDNDGLWTALYLAAQSYRYSVTGDTEALGWANQAFDAIEWLEDVTTVDGFPTKAIVAAGDDTGSDPVEWYPSSDGAWNWKGDCSSDEIDGHMYGYSIFYDLAADESCKARIVSLVNRIMGHILDNGYLIIGKDGERTRWGVWAPEYLNGPWRAQRGLNSLEILSHLKTAHHITGEARYAAAYQDLIDNHRYAENAKRVKLNIPGHVNHSDDELAFISYYPLLKYETDSALRAIYLDSLEHHWQIERPERNPWWNFIYGAVTDQPCDADLAVQTLREIPTDLIDWPIRNSHRLDLRLDSDRGRKGELQSVGVLPYDELPAHKWNFNPYSLDSDARGTREDDGTYFLLPYWMGRHYGYIGDAT